MDKKIRAYIYGAGCEYRKIMKHINHFYDKLEIRGIILTEPVENRIDGLKVFTLSEVKNEGFDLIIISVIKWQSIYEILKNNGIADNKIILGAHFYDYEFDLKKYLEESNAIENIKYYENYCAREKEHCKEAVLNYPPRWITIAVSSVCPNKCLFCAYHGEDARGNSEIYNIPFTMKMDEFVKIVDMAKTACVERIHVCGTGEPFANPHILDMLDYVILRYGDVTFQTEFWPQLFEQKNYLSEIVKRGENISSITTDICSGDPVVHEKIKYGEKFEYLMDCLETLSKEGHIYLKPFMILTRSNWKNMKNIIDEFIKRDIYNFELNIGNLFSYDYSEFTSSKNVYTSLDNDITEELYNVKEYGKSLGITVNIPMPADMTSSVCSTFWEKIQIWPTSKCDNKNNDNMVPCGCKAVVKGDISSLGNLFDYKDLMDAWNNETIVSIRRRILNGNYPGESCKDCFLYNLDDGFYKMKCR